ncbi:MULTISPECIES: hypothetical protein [unclassified Crossiella]|uniref:hypothetical protein n=1 Tax=unclassified Crossiella TaxID=2620835 RepID=UPI001FFF701C|nr:MULTISPECIES: hypothetical protein [unclassified Crossiella]MCK2240952.1 hypothetical protein [Crossiella sp. S99.2]MCK2253904.1 hypothetical protein [Crossiella sp. S99.1]
MTIEDLDALVEQFAQRLRDHDQFIAFVRAWLRFALGVRFELETSRPVKAKTALAASLEVRKGTVLQCRTGVLVTEVFGQRVVLAELSSWVLTSALPPDVQQSLREGVPLGQALTHGATMRRHTLHFTYPLHRRDPDIAAVLWHHPVLNSAAMLTRGGRPVAVAKESARRCLLQYDDFVRSLHLTLGSASSGCAR